MPPVPISIFDTIKIPFILYILFVFVSIFILLAGTVFLFWIYHSGSSVHPYFWGRLKSWFDKGYSLFEIITLMDTVILEPANYDEKKGYERIIPKDKTKSKTRIRTKEPSNPLINKKTKISLIIMTVSMLLMYIIMTLLKIFETQPLLSSIPFFILPLLPLYTYFSSPKASNKTNNKTDNTSNKTDNKINNNTTDEINSKTIEVNNNRINTERINNERNQIPVIPTSSYTINGIDTVLLWDIHPPLPDYIEKGARTLIDKKITTFEEFATLCNKEPDKILFDNYTNIEFLKMYLAYRNKFEVNIKVPTVFNFISKNFDENYSESIQIKEYNASYKTKTDNKFAKWGFIIVGIMVLGIVFKILWVTTH